MHQAMSDFDSFLGGAMRQIGMSTAGMPQVPEPGGRLARPPDGMPPFLEGEPSTGRI